VTPFAVACRRFNVPWLGLGSPSEAGDHSHFFNQCDAAIVTEFEGSCIFSTTPRTPEGEGIATFAAESGEGWVFGTTF
jgi:hypothetical protein